MKKQIDLVIEKLERALENTNDQDRAIISNIEAPGLTRDAIKELKGLTSLAGAMVASDKFVDQTEKIKELETLAEASQDVLNGLSKKVTTYGEVLVQVQKHIEAGGANEELTAATILITEALKPTSTDADTAKS